MNNRNIEGAPSQESTRYVVLGDLTAVVKF